MKLLTTSKHRTLEHTHDAYASYRRDGIDLEAFRFPFVITSLRLINYAVPAPPLLIRAADDEARAFSGSFRWTGLAINFLMKQRERRM